MSTTYTHSQIVAVRFYCREHKCFANTVYREGQTWYCSSCGNAVEPEASIREEYCRVENRQDSNEHGKAKARIFIADTDVKPRKRKAA